MAGADLDRAAPAAAAPGVRVSVVIKALNEEQHIEAAIRSALNAVAAVGGEVILADSGSQDRTVEIARSFPITVVQLANPAERRCGVGPQLGYQVARGEFVYILDGDMELDARLLPAALAAMAADPKLAGVGGLVEEESDANFQFRGRRRRRAEGIARVSPWLDMGGLYRAAALRQVGYFSDRNLHAYEEMELGLRLGAAGWTLQRLDARGVLHHGRTESSWALLGLRWRSHYLDGAGELLRATLGRRYFFRAAWTQRHLFAALLIWVGLLAGLFMWPVSRKPLLITVIGTAALLLIRLWRTRSIADAFFGQVDWQVTSLAMVRGFLIRPRNPREPIGYRTIARPGPS
jgi:glycosyltransferase involved in cell wall biosynthesis